MTLTDEACGKLTVGSLFAGIGGFDLGLERTGGFEIKWQVEIEALLSIAPESTK